MGTVLQFPPRAPEQREASRDGADRDDVAKSGDILLFTGVRYARHPEPLPGDQPPEPPTGSKKSSKKKRPAAEPTQVRAK
jgi:hypothetical protein